MKPNNINVREPAKMDSKSSLTNTKSHSLKNLVKDSKKSVILILRKIVYVCFKKHINRKSKSKYFN